MTDDLKSVADDASSDDRYKAIKDGAAEETAEESAGSSPAECVDRAVDAAQSGDWDGFRSALKEAFSDYGE